MKVGKKIILVLSFLILLGLISCSETCKQSAATDSLKVMSSNIRYNEPADGINAWTNRKSEVISMIKYYSPDLFGTQEVLKSQKDYLDSALIDYSSVGVGRADGKNGGEYSAIYYKKNLFEPLDGGTFWLSETPDKIASVGWDASMERIATWTKLKHKKSAKVFYIFNTHFDHIGQQARVNSAELILNKITEFTGNKPVILTGDFNITEDNEAYNILTSGILADARYKSELPHHGPTWTFHGFESVETNERGKIDYIFVSKDIRVLKHAVLSDRFDRGYPSDHLPVFAEIVLN